MITDAFPDFITEIDSMKDLRQAELMYPGVPQIGLSETVGFGRSVSRAPTNSTGVLFPTDTMLASDSILAFSKTVPEKNL